MSSSSGAGKKTLAERINEYIADRSADSWFHVDSESGIAFSFRAEGARIALFCDGKGSGNEGSIALIMSATESLYNWGVNLISFDNFAIKSALNISNVTLRIDIKFRGCTFEKGVVCNNSDLSSFYLEKCKLSSGDFRRTKFRGEFFLSDRTYIYGPFSLSGATIGGNFHVMDSEIVVAKGFEFSTSPESTEVAMPIYDDRCSIVADGAHFNGNFIIGPNVRLESELMCPGCVFHRDFVVAGTAVVSESGKAISCFNSRFEGNVQICNIKKTNAMHTKNLYQRFGDINTEVYGRVDISTSTIKGNIEFSGGVFCYDKKWESIVHGEQEDILRHIQDEYKSYDYERDLDGEGSRAINLKGTKVMGHVACDKGFDCIGNICFFNANINQEVILDGARILSPSSVSAYFGGMTVGGSVFFGRKKDSDTGFKSWGLIDLRHTQVKENLNFRGTSFLGGGDKVGINLTSCTVEGVFEMPDLSGFFDECDKKFGYFHFSAYDAKVRTLKFGGKSCWPPSGASVNLNNFSYGLPGDSPDDPTPGSFATHLDIIKDHHGSPTNFEPYPFTALSDEYARAGLYGAARRILVYRDRVRTKVEMVNAVGLHERRRNLFLNESREAANPIRVIINRVSRGSLSKSIAPLFPTIAYKYFLYFVRFVGHMTGYGHTPLRVIWYWLFCVFIMYGIFSMFEPDMIFVPSDTKVLLDDIYQEKRDPPDGYVPFNLFVYCLDVFMPVISLDVETHWWVGTIPSHHVNGLYSEGTLFVFRLLVWTCVVLGWTFATVFVAAFTGLFRR